MRKVHWGVLSIAKIGLLKVIPAMQRSEHCEIVALASRDRARAQAAAQELSIPKAYGSYDELLADPDIDAIYNPLPNHLHAEWSIAALTAGKHVLCEKPIGMDAAEAQAILEASRHHPHLKVMEAFMYRHHPQWQKARKLVLEGAIGDLRTIQTVFSYYQMDPANIRNVAEMGGGGLLDIGCYCASLSRWLFGCEPQRVIGTMQVDPVFDTDRLTSAVMQFGRGTATWTCCTQMVPYQRVNIYGTSGRVEIEIPFNAPPDRPCRIWHEHLGETEEIVFPICDQYTIQGDLFSLAVLQDTPVPTPLEDAVANMKVLDAVRSSAEHNQWISLL